MKIKTSLTALLMTAALSVSAPVQAANDFGTIFLPDASSSSDTTEVMTDNNSNVSYTSAGSISQIPVAIHIDILSDDSRKISTYADYSWPVMLDPSAYPELDAALTATTDKIAAIGKENFEKLQSYAESDSSNADDEDSTFYSSWQDAVICRSDTAIFSFLSDDYFSAGGPHPYSSYTTYNFDPSTGAALSIRDVASDWNTLKNVIYNRMHEQYSYLFSEEGSTIETSLNEFLDEKPDQIHWVMKNDSVEVYFNTYELGTYADGSQQLTFLFSEDRDLFSAAYTTTPDRYIQRISSYGSTYIDPDGDGSYDEMQIDSYYSDSKNSYSLTYQGTTIELEDDKLDFGKFYLVHFPSAEYIYFLGSLTDEYWEKLSIIDLNTMTLTKDAISNIDLSPTLNSSSNSGDTDNPYSPYSYEQGSFLDPDLFFISEPLKIFGNYPGNTACSIGTDGIPQLESSVSYSTQTNLFQAVQAIPCMAVDADGNPVGPAIIRAGDYVRFERTNSSDWVDFYPVAADNVKNNGSDDDPKFYAIDDSLISEQPYYYRAAARIEDGFCFINDLEQSELFRGIIDRNY
ncbi:MAG: hypothetical protein Q4B01_08070 [Eubacteriales bacterium]|nr:hypothetical protein [Eubacteriales bacterium]